MFVLFVVWFNCLFKQYFILVCRNNHWHVYVINIVTKRVKLLSSTPLKRVGTGLSKSVNLSKSISKAFKAYNLHVDLDIASFVHVFPGVVGQTNSTDYDVFTIKHMEMWNGATLVESIAPISPILLYLQFFS